MGYTDPSFQSERGDSESVSGFVFILNGGAICRKSSKQTIVVDSVCEVEYLAASDAAICVVTKVPYRARGGTSPRWLLSSVLWQHWSHSSSWRTKALTPSTFYDATTSCKRSRDEATSILWRSMENKNLIDPFAEAFEIEEFDRMGNGYLKLFWLALVQVRVVGNYVPKPIA